MNNIKVVRVVWYAGL